MQDDPSAPSTRQRQQQTQTRHRHIGVQAVVIPLPTTGGKRRYRSKRGQQKNRTAYFHRQSIALFPKIGVPRPKETSCEKSQNTVKKVSVALGREELLGTRVGEKSWKKLLAHKYLNMKHEHDNVTHRA
jgi:hypothetical protein